MKYWAFISYSHRDEKWAQWLHRAIEGYRVPGRLVGKPTRTGVVPRRLFPVFRDRDELPTSPDLGGSIIESLTHSRFLIVICSRAAATSRWVNEEVKRFKALGREDRVLCLVVDGEPNASDSPDAAQQESFPPAVRYRVSGEGLLGQERSEPLAADARPGKDGRSEAKLKLLSGLLGVGFDELKLREKERQRAGRWLSFLFAAVFGALLLLPNGAIPPLRLFIFDTYQALMPRTIQSMPAVVVEIDDTSLQRLGQWPWPRTLLAELIRKIESYRPASIGIDIWMPEPDRLSPERLLARVPVEDPVLAERLAALPSNDTELASAIRAGPVILGVVANPTPTGKTPRAPPFTIFSADKRHDTPSMSLKLGHFAGVLTSIDELDRAATGHGLLTVESDRGVIRRMQLVNYVNDTLVPALPIEMLRVALQKPLGLHVDGSAVRAVSVGDFIVPTEEDGAVRIYYSRRDPLRYVSAIDVLDNAVDAQRLRDRLILVATTASGIANWQSVPLGVLMLGSEIQAQLLENLMDQTWLRRPAWTRYAEASAFGLLAVVFILGVPHWSAAWSISALLACSAIVTTAGTAAYTWSRLLLDPVHVILGIALLFVLIMSYGFFSSFARLPDPRTLEL